MTAIRKTLVVIVSLCAALAFGVLLALYLLGGRPTAGRETAAGLARHAVTLQTQDGVCKISVSLRAYDGYHVAVSLFLEERAPGGSWRPAQFWRVSSFFNAYLLAKRQHPGASGSTYRVVYHVQVYEAGGFVPADDFTWTTAEKTMP